MYIPDAFCFLFTWSLVQPHVDFGLKLLGADLMSIPGLYKFVQVQLHNLIIYLKQYIIASWMSGFDLVNGFTKFEV